MADNKKLNHVIFLEKWTELAIAMLSKISHTQKDKLHMFLLHMESKYIKKKVNYDDLK
jgi:hypothetical protein